MLHVSQINQLCTNLKQLLHKSTLSNTDIDCATSTLDDLLVAAPGDLVPAESRARAVIGHLLIVFCLQSAAGFRVLPRVLTKVCHSEATLQCWG